MSRKVGLDGEFSRRISPHPFYLRDIRQIESGGRTPDRTI